MTEDEANRQTVHIAIRGNRLILSSAVGSSIRNETYSKFDPMHTSNAVSRVGGMQFIAEFTSLAPKYVCLERRPVHRSAAPLSFLFYA